MKVFNGKQAANDYMSAHTLAFSTPELTLMRFSFWLGDMVPDPTKQEESIPRLYTYVEEKDYAPVEIIDDDNYVPTGAVLGSECMEVQILNHQVKNNFVQNVVQRIQLQQNFVEIVELI